MLCGGRNVSPGATGGTGLLATGLGSAFQRLEKTKDEGFGELIRWAGYGGPL